MKLNVLSILRSIRRHMSACAIACGAFITLGSPVSAQPVGVYIVEDDRGGRLIDQLENIQQLRGSGIQIQIRGRICYSSCTLYLGLEETCVVPQTTFGFHGPSSFGRALDANTFRHASKAIADHYPAPLREWYLRQGRHEIHSFYRFSGADLIRMGVPQC